MKYTAIINNMSPSEFVEVAKLVYKQERDWTEQNGKLYVYDNFISNNCTHSPLTVISVYEYLKSITQ